MPVKHLSTSALLYIFLLGVPTSFQENAHWPDHTGEDRREDEGSGTLGEGCRLGSGNCWDNSTEQWAVKEACLAQSTLTDFSGRQFNFEGDDEESYNLFTEADHQLNAVLSNGRPKARQLGVTLRGVGIHGPDTRVKISISHDEQIEVNLNERIFKENATRLDGVVIVRGCTIPECSNLPDGLSVSVKDRFLTLTAWIVASNGQEPLSMSFKAALTEHPMSQVHGILGQSVESKFSGTVVMPMPSNLQFYGEGQISDYSTTDLFSSDSTFSIFTRKAERRRQRRKRQMLEGNALASMAFAAKAENVNSPSRRLPR